MKQILNKSQHRKLTPEEKILLLLLLGLEPETFRSQVRCFTAELSPLGRNNNAHAGLKLNHFSGL